MILSLRPGSTKDNVYFRGISKPGGRPSWARSCPKQVALNVRFRDCLMDRAMTAMGRELPGRFPRPHRQNVGISVRPLFSMRAVKPGIYECPSSQRTA